MDENHTMLGVEKIDFDTENPRIKMALEKYGEQLNADRIHFALRSATENGARGTSSYNGLKDSILASGRIVTPITVVKKDDKYVCIDGNTRLAIYKQFIREKTLGDWSEIKAIVLNNASPRDIETIRVSAHLVGSRQWPAYEKARYLHHLRNQQLMDYGEMIALCGGNRVDIERQIDAYHDMNEYYRDVVDDSAFRMERYSGFVELQKPQIKEAIFEVGLDLKDFGEWIRDGKIYRLDTVRQLPRVLRDDEARNTFLNGGPRSIESAIRLLDQRRSENERDGTIDNITLENASIYHLAKVLTQRINSFPLEELDALRKKEREDSVEQIGVLENLSARLHILIENVSE